jgi:hypothetical protein
MFVEKIRRMSRLHVFADELAAVHHTAACGCWSRPPDSVSKLSAHPLGTGRKFVANLFGGIGLWTSVITESWRQ